MMLAAVLLLALFATCSVTASFTPTRISYASLVASKVNPDDDERLLTALQQVGMVSITNVPSLNKQETLKALAECIAESSSTAKHTYADGTTRQTLATHTSKAGMHPFQHGSTNKCNHFDQASLDFRKTVEEVTQVLVAHLSTLVDMEEPILTSSEKDKVYSTFADVVNKGDHLEHFHSYRRHESSKQDESVTTIEWHTDQGLFLVFTPGLAQGKPTTGFFVELQDGTHQQVEFGPQDDLVILLGDGMNQVVNPKSSHILHATPHAFVMPRDASDRLWYGRMVLPPADARLHSDQTTTFGDVRRSLLNQESNGIGCSSPMRARQLENTTCEGDDEFYCWHRCMSLSEFNTSEEICQDQDLKLECIDSKGDLWNGLHNAEFHPGCTDSAELSTVGNVTTSDNGHDNGTTSDNGHHDGDGHNNDDPTSGAIVASMVGLVVTVVITIFI